MDTPPLTLEALRRAWTGLMPNFPLSDSALEGVHRYLEILLKWNRAMNLVGPGQWPEVLENLILDSFHLALFLDRLPLPESPLCLDLGAGAGLPGIPLRLVRQKGRHVLVEAREKRALFLRTVLGVIPLPGVAVFHGRAETLSGKMPPADLIISRAFMPWEKVLELTQTLIAPGGLAVFLTLTPLPESFPDGWTGEAEGEYSVSSTLRRLWAVRRSSNLPA